MYNEKTQQLALELADNIEFQKDFDLEGAKSIFLHNFDILMLVMQIWADNQRYYALEEFKKCLTDTEKQIIRLELTYKESEV